MLAIKLPKGKTAAAFERAAEQCSRGMRVLNVQYTAEVEKARKSAALLNAEIWDLDGIHLDWPERPAELNVLEIKRAKFQRRADACKHSTGDVYLSSDEWQDIKGYY